MIGVAHPGGRDRPAGHLVLALPWCGRYQNLFEALGGEAVAATPDSPADVTRRLARPISGAIGPTAAIAWATVLVGQEVARASPAGSHRPAPRSPAWHRPPRGMLARSSAHPARSPDRLQAARSEPVPAEDPLVCRLLDTAGEAGTGGSLPVRPMPPGARGDPAAG